MSVLGLRGFHAECALAALIMEVDPDEVLRRLSVVSRHRRRRPYASEMSIRGA